MAHFAKLDSNNIVIEVICVHNNELLDENQNESEQKGIDFLVNWSGGWPYWKQTSYNRNFRKNFAGPGFYYDQEKDVFIPPQPYDSWTLNEDLYMWEAPVPYPSGDEPYIWEESLQEWKHLDSI